MQFLVFPSDHKYLHQNNNASRDWNKTKKIIITSFSSNIDIEVTFYVDLVL